VKARLDSRVAAALDLPTLVSLVIGEFFRTRYQLDRGKSPVALRMPPEISDLQVYATRLRSELDAFVGRKAHHRIKVLSSTNGISVSITLARNGDSSAPEVRIAEGQEAATLKALLDAAEKKFSQWVYVKRSVKLFDGNTVHLVKPARRLEWTESQALLDADDFIAEVIENRTRQKE
jgi:hypothetical protein